MLIDVLVQAHAADPTARQRHIFPSHRLLQTSVLQCSMYRVSIELNLEHLQIQQRAQRQKHGGVHGTVILLFIALNTKPPSFHDDDVMNNSFFIPSPRPLVDIR